MERINCRLSAGVFGSKLGIFNGDVTIKRCSSRHKTGSPENNKILWKYRKTGEKERETENERWREPVRFTYCRKCIELPRADCIDFAIILFTLSNTRLAFIAMAIHHRVGIDSRVRARGDTRTANAICGKFKVFGFDGNN